LIPGLEDIQILSPEGQPVVYLAFGDSAHPAALAGDRIVHLLRLAFELASRKGGVVLVEEPETHMHPGAIRQAAKAIVGAVRRQVQVILTTHSLEFIDALIGEAGEKNLSLLSLYRLQLLDGTLKSSRLTGSEIAFARNQIQDDLR
jgi:AAA15 family ATPase/GTPase